MKKKKDNTHELVLLCMRDAQARYPARLIPPNHIRQCPDALGLVAEKKV